MESKSYCYRVLGASSLLLAAPLSASGTQLFLEDAEGGNLNQWIGQFGGSHSGTIVSDPLRVGNHVITFANRTLGGDIFTAAPITFANGQQYRISFEYLGKPTPNSVSHDTGGFFGMSEDLPGNHMWYYGTSTLFSSPTYSDTLIDDGTWHQYQFLFTPPLFGLGNHLRLMFEDWVDAGGVAGDAFFDNIKVEAVTRSVPEGGNTWGMLATSGLALAWSLRRFGRNR